MPQVRSSWQASWQSVVRVPGRVTTGMQVAGARAARAAPPSASTHPTDARLGAVSPTRMRLGEPRTMLKVCAAGGRGQVCKDRALHAGAEPLCSL